MSKKFNLGKIFKTKNTKYGTYSALISLLVIAIVIVINLIFNQLPSEVIHYDMSARQLYSISDQTEDILENLDLDVHIYALVSELNKDQTLDEMMQRYLELSDRLDLTYIDPDADPTFASNYDASGLGANSLVVESEKRFTTVDIKDIWTTEMDYETYAKTGEQNTTTYFDGESCLTAAIDYVVTDDLPMAYILEGHGETSLTREVTSALSRQNIATDTLNLMTAGSIPEDCRCLIINGPTKDFSDDETAQILDYMERGGDMVLLASMVGRDMPNFDMILETYGVSLTKGWILEADNSYFVQSLAYLLPQLEPHVLTNPIKDNNMYVLMYEAQGITELPNHRENLLVLPLMTTSESAYNKSVTLSADDEAGITAKISTAEKEPGDLTGPFYLGVAIQERLDDNEEDFTRFVVFSSEYLINKGFTDSTSFANMDMFVNAVSWMCEHESSINIHAKAQSVKYLTVSTAQVNFWIVALIVLVVLILAAGIVIWARRRKR